MYPEQTNPVDDFQPEASPDTSDANLQSDATESKAHDVEAEKLFHKAPPKRNPQYDEDRIYDLSELTEEDEYTAEEKSYWEARYSETMKEYRSGELVMGRVVAINDSDIAVDIGFKSEGNIPKEEFDNLDDIKIGDEIEVCIESVEDSEGALKLSKRKAEFIRVWEKIRQFYQTGEMVEAQVVRRIKGGMVVDLFGIEAFLPGSQIDVHPVRDFDALVGAMMDFRIIKVNEARKNIVLSHKVLVEESLREIREKVLSELEEGQVVEGVVKNITDFGVFIDLGGVDGLLHITDLSWGRVTHPSDIVSLDERIKVKVLHYDKDRKRISLGLKQLQEHHWDEIDDRYPVGNKARGKVISIVKYGAFIELESGIEGLVHISEMSWTQHIKHPSQMVSVGDEVEVVVLNIDKENRKISLGMKQVDEDPWIRIESVYQPGTKHKGVVRDLVPFGAFVELEPGIDGLIHISDLSWTRKVRHPGEIVKKGQEIEVVIISFDKNERRIALGLKQLEDDPWDRFEREYPIRSRTEGSVIRVLEKGVVIMLPMGVEGFIPNSQLGKALSAENKKKIQEGDNLELEVIEFDKNNHRIVLSHAIVERAKEKAAYRTSQESGEEGKTTIGDMVQSPDDEPVVEVTETAESVEIPPDQLFNAPEEIPAEEKSIVFEAEVQEQEAAIADYIAEQVTPETDSADKTQSESEEAQTKNSEQTDSPPEEEKTKEEDK